MAVKKVPVKAVMVVREPKPAMAKAAGVENTAAAKPAAMKYGTAASEAAAMEAAPTAVETASAATPMAASATTPMATAADFSRQPVRDGFRCRRRSGIDQ